MDLCSIATLFFKIVDGFIIASVHSLLEVASVYDYYFILTSFVVVKFAIDRAVDSTGYLLFVLLLCHSLIPDFLSDAPKLGILRKVELLVFFMGYSV